MLLPSPAKTLPAVSLTAAGAAVAVGALWAPALGPGVWALALLPLLGAAWVWAARFGRVEQALRHSEARKAAVLQAAPDAVVAVDRDGRVVEYNAAAERLFGHPPGRTLGRPFADLVRPGRHRDGWQKVLAKALAGPGGSGGRRVELTACRADGSEFPAEVTVARTETPAGPVVIGFVRDLTDRKRAEEALKASEERYHGLVEQAADAIFVLDSEGRIEDVNRRACESLGYTRAELLGRKVTDIDEAARRTALRVGETTTLDALHRRKDGSTFPVEVRLAVLDGGNRPVKLALARDVSARRRAENALKESERRFRETLETARLIAVWLDLDARVTFCNDALLALTGYRRDEVVGRNWFDTFVPAEDREALRARFARNVRSGQLLTHFEGEVLTRAGQRRLIAWNNTALKDPDGRPVGSSSLGEDVTDRRRAEAALQRSESLLRLVWETAADGMRLTDADGTVVLANPSYGRLVGRETGELVGRSMADPYDPARRADILRKHQARFRTRAGRDRAEIEVALADGRRRWFEVSNSFLDVAGEAPLLLTVFRDVTDRRRHEDALRESEERYRYLFEANPHPMWVFDTETLHFLAVNQAAVSRYGYTREEFLGMTVTDIRPPEDVPAFLADVRGRDEKASAAGVWRHRWKDGTVRDVDVTANALRYGDRPARLVLAVDVTERRQTEAALHAREELLWNIVTHIPCGVFWKDRESVYLGCNEQVARDAGFTVPDELVGRTDRDLGYSREEADFYRDCDRKVMGSGIALLNIEEPQTRSDGKAVLLTSKVPLRDGSGAVVGVLGVYQDITERKKLEEQLRQAQKMEAVGRLAGGIAHDFNNLLTVINGYSQVLMDALGPGDPNRPLVEEIERAGDRAAGLTRQLLAFSRRQVLEPRVLCLNEVVGDTDRMLRRLIGEDVLLTTCLDPSLGRVRVDPGQLQQVLMNLVVNARDAMPKGGRLAITTRNVTAPCPEAPDLPPGAYVELGVNDTGVGMDERTKARLFEPFFTTKGPGQGTGLGLATVYGIVTQSDGHVAVETAPGRGTTFRVYLPRVNVSLPKVGARPLAADALPRGVETLLLVEDEPAVRDLDRRVLTDCGYTVLEARDGREAVRVARGHDGRIDLLVSDVVMPHLGGRELAEELLAIRPEVKVLFVSGYTDDAIVRHGVGAEYAFLQKPFSPAGLAKKVREVLDKA